MIMAVWCKGSFGVRVGPVGTIVWQRVKLIAHGAKRLKTPDFWNYTGPKVGPVQWDHRLNGGNGAG
jgi:hypothetical protein